MNSKTAEYLHMQLLAQQEINHGHARAYAVGYTPERGRYIEIQTDAGWNPAPFWQEHQPDHDHNPEGQDLHI